MSDPIASLNLLAAGWAGAMARACWQGGLALALVGALCRLLPRLPGRVQCWLWRLAYLKLCVALVWVVPLDLPVLPRSGVQAFGRSGVRAVGRSGVQAFRGHRRDAVVLGVQALDRESVRRSAGGEVGERSADGVIEGLTTHDLRLATTLLLLLWPMGMGWRGAQVLGDWRRARRLRAQGEAVQDGALIGECRALCRQLGIRREPGLRTADSLGCPVLVGVARPAVVLPAAFVSRFTRADLRLMLAHELAHLQRRDLLWAWLPNLVRVLFFFHPLVWLAEGEWRLAHEMACDEYVLLCTGAPRSAYGGMLLEVMGQAPQAVPAGLLAAGVAESYATVRRRLVAIRQIRAISRRRWALVSLLLATSGTAGMVPWRLTAAPARPQWPSGEARRLGRARARMIELRGDQRALESEELASAFSPGFWETSRFSSSSHPRAGSGSSVRVGSPDMEKSGSKLRVFQRGRPHRRGASLEGWGMREKAGRAPMLLSSVVWRGHGAVRLLRREATRGFAGAAWFEKTGPATERQGVVVAALPPLPVASGEYGAIRSDTSHSRATGMKRTGAGADWVILLDRKSADPDSADPDPEQAAFEKGMVSRKWRRTAAMLFVPKAVVSPAALFGWEPSPLFRAPKGLEVRINGSLDPGELKRILAQAGQGNGIDPGNAARILEGASQEGIMLDPRVLVKAGIDPRALKKMLAQAHPEEAGAAGLFEKMPWPLPEKMLLTQQRLDQQKHEMEKQQDRQMPSVKPSGRIEPGF